MVLLLGLFFVAVFVLSLLWHLLVARFGQPAKFLGLAIAGTAATKGISYLLGLVDRGEMSADALVGGAIGAALGLLLVWIYFLPSHIARKRNHVDGVSIFAVNALLGWTLIGWVVAFAWATRGIRPNGTVAAPETNQLTPGAR